MSRLKAIHAGKIPVLSVLDIAVNAKARWLRIRRNNRGVLRRGWLGLRDIILRPALGV